MILNIRLGASALQQWHLSLIERIAALVALRLQVEIAGAPDKDDDGGWIAPLLALEGRLRGKPSRGMAAPAPPEAFARWMKSDTATPDLTLDLTGTTAAREGRCWRLTVDGAPGLSGLFAAALGGGTPAVRIMEGDATIAEARLGTDRSDVASFVVDDMLERLVTLLVAALRGARPMLPALPKGNDEPASGPLSRGWVAGHLGVSVARGALGAVYRSLHRSPHWRVGWRRLQGPDLFALKDHPDSGWRELPDDGTRFYADPFPFVHEGRLTLFVEDFVHAVGRAVISAVAFGEDGPLGAPEPVLELPEHLSYPFVFARDGEIWMIPECCQSGRVDLYRATAFPGGWVREATLLPDTVASDVTLTEHEGRWWMFATVRDGGGFSDALHLWSAPDFRGPWTPHAGNPVLIDIASARSAGRMVHRDGALLRPVQDCRKGYGRALGLARVLRLDDAGYEQQVDAIIEAGGPLWAGRRVHTLNSAGGFEFIDGSAKVRRSLPWEPHRR